MVTVAVAVVVLGRLTRAGQPVTAVAVTAMVGLLVSPVSWTHHWVWLLPLTGALLLEGSGPVRRVTGLVIVEICAAAGPWHVPNYSGREFGWTGWQFITGNSYTLGAVLVLAVLLVTLPRTPPHRRWPGPTPGSTGAGAPTRARRPHRLVDAVDGETSPRSRTRIRARPASTFPCTHRRGDGANRPIGSQ